MALIHRLLAVVGIAAACLLAGVGIIVMPAAALIGWLALGLLVGVLFGVNDRRRAAAASEPALQPPPDLSLKPARLTTTPPAEMSTEQLCLAWRQSYTALQQTMPGPERDVIVGVRAGYLDELERRDQQGFSRWLESGARAGSDPSRYLATGGEPEGTLR